VSFVKDILAGTWLVLADAAPWLLVSYVLAGLMHEFVSPERLQTHLGNKRLSSIVKATFSGMLLPMCSCGAIPLGLSLYYSGAYLGPALAFMVAAPMINPAAILLTYGLLGPKIATIYVAGGILIPILVGLIANALGGDQLHAEGIDEVSRVQLAAAHGTPLKDRLLAGLSYGFGDLGVVVSKYVAIGALSAGVLFALIPGTFIDRYLGDPGLLSLFGVSVLGATMYVCAVGHIPFIAAIVAAGAAPGTAITFLMAGAATNVPEFIMISKLIGKRTALFYSVVVVFFALGMGWFANLLIGDGFVPFIDPERSAGTIAIANWFIITVPVWLQVLSAVVVVGLGLLAYRSKLTALFSRIPARAES
jgi:uncharacterized membrane protein YraQ (UPF0718 family)